MAYFGLHDGGRRGGGLRGAVPCVAVVVCVLTGPGAWAQQQAPEVVRARAYLERLVSMDTRAPVPRERPLAEEIAAHLKKQGIYAHTHVADDLHAAVVARLGNPADRRPAAVLWGALDTLACPTKAQHGDSTRVAEVDGRLWGCGTAHTKAFAAAAVSAFVEVHQRHPDAAQPVVLVLTGDGHSPGVPGLAHLLEVLPGLGHGGRVFFPLHGGAWADHRATWQVGVLPQVDVKLVGSGQGAAWPWPEEPQGAPTRLYRGLAHLAAFAFDTMPGALSQDARAKWETHPPGGSAPHSDPRVRASWQTRCRVAAVHPPAPASAPQDRAWAQLACTLAEGDRPERLSWQVVDALAEPSVTVERLITPPPPAPRPPDAQESAALAGWAGVPMDALALPGAPPVARWAREGLLLRGVEPFGLPAQDAALAGTAAESISQTAFARGVGRMTGLVRMLAGGA